MAQNNPVPGQMSQAEIAYWQRLAREYEAYLGYMASKHMMAVRFGLKSCQRCGQCCLRFCTPRPDEIAPVAQHLGMSVDELVNKYLVIDTADCKTFFLRWIKHGEEDLAGKRIPPLRTFDRGYCIMYDEKNRACLIHPVRPREAKYIKCWEKDSGTDLSMWGATHWSETDIYRFVTDFNPLAQP